MIALFLVIVEVLGVQQAYGHVENFCGIIVDIETSTESMTRNQIFAKKEKRNSSKLVKTRNANLPCSFARHSTFLVAQTVSSCKYVSIKEHSALNTSDE